MPSSPSTTRAGCSGVARGAAGRAAAGLPVRCARGLFGRRQESTRLWVVRRADIHDLSDPDLLQPPLDRSFKKPGGYVMRDKLAAAREQSGALKPQGNAK